MNSPVKQMFESYLIYGVVALLAAELFCIGLLILLFLDFKALSRVYFLEIHSHS